MAGFDEATNVIAKGDGSYELELDEAWTIGPNRPNGGYLLATLGRAALDAARSHGGGQRHPIAATAHYVSPPTTGPATAETEVLRIGRSASQVRARLIQDDTVCVEATLTLGTLEAGGPPWWGNIPPVELPPEDECTSLGSVRQGVEGPSLRRSIVERFDPATVGFIEGAPSGGGELRTWFRFADGRPVDPLALLFVVDGLPPATFDIVATGWVPTLELTAYIRAVPAPGPLRIRFRAGIVHDGLVDETCEVWDSADRLVAQSTQLAGIRLP